MNYNSREEKTLILNADYTIIKTINWQTAMKLFYSNKVSIVENYDRFINHPTVKIQVPAVVALKKYYPVMKHQKVKFSSETLYARDNYTCAYCNNQFAKGTLTKDHIIPKTHFKQGKATGKETSWLNIVTACKECNNRKGGRTPKEAGMQLRFSPYEPKNFSFAFKKDSVPKEWLAYVK